MCGILAASTRIVATAMHLELLTIREGPNMMRIHGTLPPEQMLHQETLKEL